MEGNEEKKRPAISELILDVVCLAASYGILFLLPRETGFFFYLCFGISAFLFCIGFFRLGFSLPAPGGPALTVLLYLTFGAVLNAVGLYGIGRDNGSGRSITVATLLVIEALVFFALSGNHARSPGTRRAVPILFRIAAALLVLSCAAYLWISQFSETAVIAGTMLVIEAICLWKMGAGSNPFNTLTPEIQVIPGMKAPIEQIYRDFAHVETQLGYPWVGKIRTIKEDAVIYGPLKDGFYVCGYYHFGRFYVSGSENPFFPPLENAESRVVTELAGEDGILLAKHRLSEAYASMFTRYAENGKTQWTTELSDKSEKAGKSNGEKTM